MLQRLGSTVQVLNRRFEFWSLKLLDPRVLGVPRFRLNLRDPDLAEDRRALLLLGPASTSGSPSGGLWCGT